MPSSTDERSVTARGLDPADPAAFQQFLAVTGTTSEQIRQLGEDAQQLGCAAKITEKEMRSTYPETVMLLRNIKPDWSLTDGTAATTSSDTGSRYTVGAPYDNNSCAIDVCLFIGIFLGVGRVQGDQISFQAASDLPPPAYLLRVIASSRWGEISSTERGKLRDVLRQSLAEYDNVTFPAGRFLSIQDVFTCLFTGSPLVSSTSVRGYVCCNNRVYIAETVKIKRQVSWQLPFLNGSSIESSLNALLSSDQHSDKAEPCSTHCARNPKGQLLVLDRLPPILVIGCSDTLWNIALGNGNGKGLDEISIQYRSPTQLESIKYRFCGVVLHHGQNHFIIRVLYDGKTIEYDGLNTEGRAMECSGWQSGLPRSIRTCLLLYTCISS